MIYEFRMYKLHEGKLQAFKDRFERVSIPFFEKHGIKFRGFYEIGRFPKSAAPQFSKGGIVKKAGGMKFGQDEIAYLVAFDSIEQRDKAWLDFVADEEWQRIKAESEKDGLLVKDETCFVLEPANFSPIR